MRYSGATPGGGQARPLLRAQLGRWRWLLLGSLGWAQGACEQSEESPPSAPPRNVTAPSACEQGTPLGGGWERCANGMLHRTEIGVCPSSLPRPRQLSSSESAEPDAATSPDAAARPPELECIQDSDCSARPHGHCEADVAVYCVYGCATDEDCGAGEVCVCGDPIGTCHPARCRTDGDCEPGASCGSYTSPESCYSVGFACQTPEDECAGNADCGSRLCLVRDPDPAAPGKRECGDALCFVPGRPFLVAGELRLAGGVARNDWCAREPARGPIEALPEQERAAIAAGWARQGLMEHASVAAFARFTLQLLALGAPPELVLDATRAQADELQHARDCFGLAQRHGAGAIGPGPLPIEGALADGGWSAAVLDAVREGCVGETLAALEAVEALERCEDATARDVLARIAADETRHAELAWRFVAWALEVGPAQLAGEVRAAFAEQLGALPSPVAEGPLDACLARHGLLGEGIRRALRQRASREVIAPCARALLARAEVCVARERDALDSASPADGARAARAEQRPEVSGSDVRRRSGPAPASPLSAACRACGGARSAGGCSPPARARARA